MYNIQRISLKILSGAYAHVPRSRHVASPVSGASPSSAPSVDKALSSAHCPSILMRYLTNRIRKGINLTIFLAYPVNISKDYTVTLQMEMKALCYAWNISSLGILPGILNRCKAKGNYPN